MAAVVAAPILKLCPAKSLAGRPALVRADLTSSTNFVFVRGDPSSQINKAPGFDPLLVKYLNMANTGQISSPVLPTITLIPILPWSVLDCLIFREITVGSAALSATRSLKDK